MNYKYIVEADLLIQASNTHFRKMIKFNTNKQLILILKNSNTKDHPLTSGGIELIAYPFGDYEVSFDSNTRKETFSNNLIFEISMLEPMDFQSLLSALWSQTPLDAVITDKFNYFKINCLITPSTTNTKQNISYPRFNETEKSSNDDGISDLIHALSPKK
jgi:hypothetical protein|tara:strand:- start:7136 stop:7615 length:480 start_codon:yes stop_codon:yes gene_type:complete